MPVTPVEGFRVDIRHAVVTGLAMDGDTVTLTLVVPTSAVLCDLAGPTRLVRRDK